MRFGTGMITLLLLAFAAGCSTTEQAGNLNSNANSNMAGPTVTTRTGPDNSEITTTTDPNGVRTETRVFRDNRRVSRVVVTTRDGQRTVRVVSPSGEEREANDLGDALDATGDKIADAAGFVGDKAEDVAGKTVDTAKTVGEKTAEGAKTVGTKTAEGAKKTGEALKKVVP
ncbi:MAG TPA: hypothetical protein VJ124_18060 [Pyrinomonadaceae bacterium]|nr:hypothetical protein [Pyrinomonadaceae bacterium]